MSLGVVWVTFGVEGEIVLCLFVLVFYFELGDIFFVIDFVLDDVVDAARALLHGPALVEEVVGFV